MESPRQRIVVKETVYWQSRGSKPQSVSTSFVRSNETDQVLYSHPNLKVGEEWQSLNTGWLDKPGMLVIENLPEVRRTVPTPEEVKTARARIVEVAVSGAEDHIPSCHVPVGESYRFTPPFGDVSKFRIRCLSGETKVNVTAFPGGSGD